MALSWFLKALFPDVGLFGRVDGLCMVLHPAGEMIRDDELAVEDTELMKFVLCLLLSKITL